MAITIGDQQLQLADDYAAALDAIGDRATDNTRRALLRAMRLTLRDLRRWYSAAVDPQLPAERSADGVTRRPRSYSIAESSRKLTELQRIAQAFLTPAELQALTQQYQADLERAVNAGGDLGQQLQALTDPDTVAASPFVGPNREAIRAAANTTSAYIRAEVESFRDRLTQIVTSGVGRGQGFRAIEKDVRVALQGARDPQGLTQSMGLLQRAELIARSELSNAYVNAQKTAAERNGYQYARWIATKDERTCPVCASRHGKIYRLSEVVGTQHPRCVLGDTPVSPGPMAAAFRAVYSGDVVTIGLGDGSRTTVTAEHPMLTRSGIKPAHAIRQGDHLVSYRMKARTRRGSSPNLHEVPATAEDIFAAFAKSGAVATESVPATALDLHGDGKLVKGNIDIVRADGLFEGYWDPLGREDGSAINGVFGCVRFRPFTTLRHSDLAVFGLGAAACGSVSRLREALSLLGGGLGHAEEHRIAATAWRDPDLLQPAHNDGTTYAELFGECLNAFPGVIEVQEVADIDRKPFVGHVYTFETYCGFYSTGEQIRLINQNCRCGISPVSTEAVEEADPKVRAELLRTAYWEKSQEEVAKAFAKGKGWPFDKASKVLDEHMRKPSPSERRQFPSIETAALPVG